VLYRWPSKEAAATVVTVLFIVTTHHIIISSPINVLHHRDRAPNKRPLLSTMARKRMRRRRDPNTPGSSSQPGGDQGQGHNNQPIMIDGKMVHIRQISTIDEGVLYTHAISVSSL
jgi:hypothetical protein